MKTFLNKNIAIAAGLAFLACGAAFAGTDNTFNGPVGQLTNWLEGTMGQMFAIGSLAVGLGIGIVKQSVMSVAVGTGIALSASAGPAVLSGIFNAVI